MDKNAKIYIAGHRGLVGSALIRALTKQGYNNLVTRTHAELDLTDQLAVFNFFENEKPEFVLLAAAKVGGIQANNMFPAEFIYDNLAIQTNVIHASYLHKVNKLLFLGSSCIYPKNASQPMLENCLLTSSLEPTNRPYALAKIAGIEMCWSYNRQYGTQYLAVMPTNLYGPDDNYHPENSHVIPGLIQKFHTAKINNHSNVTLWGTGSPYREFLYSEDMAKACIFLLNQTDDIYKELLGSTERSSTTFSPPLINIGFGSDISIQDLANLVKTTVGYSGEVKFDTSKPDGPLKKLLNSDKLKQLGFKPSIDLEEGLKRSYLDFLKKHA